MTLRILPKAAIPVPIHAKIRSKGNRNVLIWVILLDHA